MRGRKDNQAKIAIILSYPPKNSRHFKFGGVASYTRNLTDSLRNQNTKLIVIANKINGKEGYTEGKVKVIRCWNKGILYLFQIFWNVLKYRGDIQVVHLQHEYFLYGGAISAALFPFLLLLLKLLHRPIIVTLHGVISLSKFNRNFREQNDMTGILFIFKIGLLVITKMICCFSKRVIVHENYFRDVLVKEYGISINKITVIPHGIEDKKSLIPKEKAKQILGVKEKKILLFFGYITGYKGVEILIDAFNYLKERKYILFIASGEHPRLKNNLKYKAYFKNLKEKAEEVSRNIIFTGFVSEDKIPLYFSAADLVIFPYRILMASSGPLAMSMTYEKPIIVSESFNELVGLKSCIFKKNPNSLARKIEEILSSHSLRCEIINYVKKVKEERSWKIIGAKHAEVYRKVINLHMVRTR